MNKMKSLAADEIVTERKLSRRSMALMGGAAAGTVAALGVLRRQVAAFRAQATQVRQRDAAIAIPAMAQAAERTAALRGRRERRAWQWVARTAIHPTARAQARTVDSR